MHRRVSLSLAALVATLGLATSVSGAPSSLTDDLDPAAVARGHDILLRNCAMCHAIEATGDSPVAAAPAFRDLHLRYPIDQLGEAFAEGLRSGHPMMPEFDFSSDEAADIMAYLKSVQTLQSTARPGAPLPG
ncbi:MAG: cytochrome c [Caulobacteraceae bacterium]